MILYHFSCHEHLPSILEDGSLDVTESNIGCPDVMPALYEGITFKSVGERVGPDVVWFFGSANPTIKRQTMLMSSVDKRLVRIAVDVPSDEAHWWPEWSEQQGIDREWYKTLAEAGRPTEWFVVEKPVHKERWVSVETRQSVDDPWERLDV